MTSRDADADAEVDTTRDVRSDNCGDNQPYTKG